MNAQNLKDHKALGALISHYRGDGHKIDDHWFRAEVANGSLPAVMIGQMTYIHPVDFAEAFKRYCLIRTKVAKARETTVAELFDSGIQDRKALAALQEIATAMANSMLRIESMIAAMHDSLGCTSKKNP